jgi:hypothetical protein
MRVSSDRELASTRRKLRLLEQSYEAAQNEGADDLHLRDVELGSLKRLINQLKEEIARYEARQPARR